MFNYALSVQIQSVPSLRKTMDGMLQHKTEYRGTELDQ